MPIKEVFGEDEQEFEMLYLVDEVINSNMLEYITWEQVKHNFVKAKCTKHAKWNIAQINPRGASVAEKRNAIDEWGNRYKIDFILLSECKINANCPKMTDNYVWFFSS